MGKQREKRRIPLEQRFQIGRLRSKGVAALEFELEDQGWAKTVRVAEADLPSDRSLADYRIGDRYTLFLLRPFLNDPTYYHASLRFSARDVNPWFSSPPRIGDLVEGRAIGYPPDNRRVYIRLDSGIDVSLPSEEVPGGGFYTDIRELIDLGDRVVAEIINVYSELLEVTVSVKAALDALREREQQRRIDEFGQGAIRGLSRKEWALPWRDDGMLVGVFGPDLYFSGHLIRWLENFGVPARKIDSPDQLQSTVSAERPPTHIVCAVEQWPQAQSNILKSQIDRNGIRLIWLQGAASPSLPPFSTTTIRLPLPLHELLRALDDPAYIPKPMKEVDSLLHSEVQARRVQKIAERFLGEICDEAQLDAALWVVQEGEDIYVPRAWHNLQADQVHAIKPRLGQSLIADSIKQNKEIIWRQGEAGPLQLLFPSTSNRILCMPIPVRHDNGGVESEVSRAVAFFFHDRHPGSRLDRPEQHPVMRKLRPQLHAMEILVHAYQLSRHNEKLAAFSELGRNAASYLHELGQKALPVQSFLDRYAVADQVPASEWRTLRKQLQELIEMAKGDLARIGRRHSDRLQLKNQLIRLLELNAIRFNTADCALLVELPPTPLLLHGNPLVIDHVVGNLLDNALYFIEKLKGGGRAVIRVRLDPESDPVRPLLIEVEDNGSGVRATMAPHLFEPRYSDKADGTGMGLFIASSYVQGLGGTLALIESVRWSRTRFAIRLPIVLNQWRNS